MQTMYKPLTYGDSTTSQDWEGATSTATTTWQKDLVDTYEDSLVYQELKEAMLSEESSQMLRELRSWQEDHLRKVRNRHTLLVKTQARLKRQPIFQAQMYLAQRKKGTR